ncbi:MAG: hypothetical protein KatS3mg010_1575 [Acidimicrobiia bacterium]|nr:MAG: hypothetical protein KatS3mg010_1575 [Acidimicrobiia bacterium]
MTSAVPSAIIARVPAGPVLLGERHERTARPGARPAASCLGQQHQREQPGDLAVVGQRTVQHPRQPDRLRREVRADQASAPDDAVYPSLNIRYSTARTAATRAGRSRSSGRPNVAPAPRTCCFARLIRCAMVASGTRNARAISAVVSPPTARSVSATCDGGVSAGVAAQEEQRQRVVLADPALVLVEGPSRPRVPRLASAAGRVGAAAGR